MQVNLTAAAQLCRHAVLHWHERGAPGEKTGGRIVNIASRADYRGDRPAHWHYAASKSAMVAMTKTIARAYAKDGILAVRSEEHTSEIQSIMCNSYAVLCLKKQIIHHLFTNKYK